MKIIFKKFLKSRACLLENSINHFYSPFLKSVLFIIIWNVDFIIFEKYSNIII